MRTPRICVGAEIASSRPLAVISIPGHLYIHILAHIQAFRSSQQLSALSTLSPTDPPCHQPTATSSRSAPDFKEKLQAKRQQAAAKAAHAQARAQAQARAAQGGARGGPGPAAGPAGGARAQPMPSVEEMKGVLMQELQIGQMLSKQGACVLAWFRA